MEYCRKQGIDEGSWKCGAGMEWTAAVADGMACTASHTHNSVVVSPSVIISNKEPNSHIIRKTKPKNQLNYADVADEGKMDSSNSSSMLASKQQLPAHDYHDDDIDNNDDSADDHYNEPNYNANEDIEDKGPDYPDVDNVDHEPNCNANNANEDKGPDYPDVDNVDHEPNCNANNANEDKGPADVDHRDFLSFHHQDFDLMFPFFLTLDQDMRILQAGSGLRKVCPQICNSGGVEVKDVLQISYPVHQSWASLKEQILSEQYLLSELPGQAAVRQRRLVLMTHQGLLLVGSLVTTIAGSTSKHASIKGGQGIVHGSSLAVHHQAAACTSKDNSRLALLASTDDLNDLELQNTINTRFVGSPKVEGLDDLKARGMLLTDLPGLDLSVDFLLLSEQHQAELHQKEMIGLDVAACTEQAVDEHKDKSVEAHFPTWNRNGVSHSFNASGSRHNPPPSVLRAEDGSHAPASAAIHLLDTLLSGGKIHPEDVTRVRDSLLKAGDRPWQPLNVSAVRPVGNSLFGEDDDSEVNMALQHLLCGPPQGFFHQDYPSSAANLVSTMGSDALGSSSSNVILSSSMSGIRQRSVGDLKISNAKSMGLKTKRPSASLLGYLRASSSLMTMSKSNDNIVLNSSALGSHTSDILTASADDEEAAEAADPSIGRQTSNAFKLGSSSPNIHQETSKSPHFSCALVRSGVESTSGMRSLGHHVTSHRRGFSALDAVCRSGPNAVTSDDFHALKTTTTISTNLSILLTSNSNGIDDVVGDTKNDDHGTSPVEEITAAASAPTNVASLTAVYHNYRAGKSSEFHRVGSSRFRQAAPEDPSGFQSDRKHLPATSSPKHPTVEIQATLLALQASHDDEDYRPEATSLTLQERNDEDRATRLRSLIPEPAQLSLRGDLTNKAGTSEAYRITTQSRVSRDPAPATTREYNAISKSFSHTVSGRAHAKPSDVLKNLTSKYKGGGGLSFQRVKERIKKFLSFSASWMSNDSKQDKHDSQFNTAGTVLPLIPSTVTSFHKLVPDRLLSDRKAGAPPISGMPTPLSALANPAEDHHVHHEDMLQDSRMMTSYHDAEGLLPSSQVKDIMDSGLHRNRSMPSSMSAVLQNALLQPLSYQSGAIGEVVQAGSTIGEVVQAGSTTQLPTQPPLFANSSSSPRDMSVEGTLDEYKSVEGTLDKDNSFEDRNTLLINQQCGQAECIDGSPPSMGHYFTSVSPFNNYCAATDRSSGRPANADSDLGDSGKKEPAPAKLPFTRKQMSGLKKLVVNRVGRQERMRISLVSEPTDLLAGVLSGIDEWQFDPFVLSQASFGRPLSVLTFTLFKKAGLIDSFHLNSTKLARFLLRIEEGYPSNPYHGATHAADVLHTLHVIMTRGGVLRALSRAESLPAGRHNGHRPLSEHDGKDRDQSQQKESEDSPLEASSFTLLTCYIAAMVHDFDHRGVNNDFLIRSGDPLALLYNDISPQENHHIAAAFTLMRNEQYDFIPSLRNQGFSSKVKTLLRKYVIDLVLSTDMRQHFALTSLLSTKVVSSRKQSNQKSFICSPSKDVSPDRHHYLHFGATTSLRRRHDEGREGSTPVTAAI
ncbi:hypothetical protein CEUSTIGMA_g8412.t1 [Chlamydomonas eustigma]|uniref:Phosphodiesterase n=1 Tax=Chlamydomonas eustigma TaxID=1157962 RepID=A0A250XD07_9CHLO|nr:hypothetical protein CEUSTIGMA_g8412.t1 [Chlamydomonas eustigma]|eukprot:GAX80977.1 hypothetical protein CEUSTIGMA_g8412.t1 [Chlamydomonas eustigma]